MTNVVRVVHLACQNGPVFNKWCEITFNITWTVWRGNVGGFQIPQLTFRNYLRQHNIISSDIFRAVLNQMLVLFWVSEPCNGYMFRRFREIYCLHHQSDCPSKYKRTSYGYLHEIINSELPASCFTQKQNFLRATKCKCNRLRCENFSHRKVSHLSLTNVRWNMLLTTFQVTWKLCSLLSREV